jgi:hypothetical protein
VDILQVLQDTPEYTIDDPMFAIPYQESLIKSRPKPIITARLKEKTVIVKRTFIDNVHLFVPDKPAHVAMLIQIKKKYMF